MHKLDNGYKEWKTYDEETILFENYDKIRFKCSRCGHTLHIPYNEDKKLCSYCGYYVFKNKKDEFNYRTIEKLRRKNEEIK